MPTTLWPIRKRNIPNEISIGAKLLKLVLNQLFSRLKLRSPFEDGISPSNQNLSVVTLGHTDIFGDGIWNGPK